MRPVLFQIGSFRLYSFGLMAALALIVPGLTIVRPLIKRRGVSADFAYELVVAAGVGGFVGARIYYLIENYAAVKADFWGVAFGGIGFVWYGGLIGGFLGVVGWTLVRRMPMDVVANAMAPAVALGYAIGGSLADKFQRTAFLAAPLAIAGVFIFFIPKISPPLINAIVNRHPVDQNISMLWMKVDPAFGSAVIFFLPCFVLAILSPYMIRITARRLEQVGAVSGLIYAASTVGSIGGVFVSGYILIDYLTVTAIFRTMGVVVLVLAGLVLAMDYWLGGNCKAVAKETKSAN